ncbi:MAG: class I SAM-dependent methyltransferase [Brachymonas sp.]|nr:class I SAM-dependent methyltransferase [Brachymonas sp.]
MKELERAQQQYRQRDSDPSIRSFWSLSNPVALHLLQERERAVLRAMSEAGMALENARVLDVGCGSAQEFPGYMRWGVQASQLFGVDLSLHRVQAATARGIGTVVHASGNALPFANASFDGAIQNVVFSSIMDSGVRQQVAREMCRVLRPGGWILWYDAICVKSSDPHFRGVPLQEVESLFPDITWYWQRVTTHVGLLKRIHAFMGEGAMRAFDLTGLFKTHRLGLGRMVA